MKEIEVKCITTALTPTAASVPALLDEAGTEFNTIGFAPWANDYPYQPDVKFRIAYTGEALLLHFIVDEEYVAAAATDDNGHVWEDSCCEFFCQPDDDGTYYNVECNCMGTLLLGYGATRDNRELAPQQVLKTIDRWSSLKNGDVKTLSLERSEHPWQLALVIPLAAFFHHNIDNIEGKTLRANFYKCGDNLPKPHFMAWNNIALPKPDFHRPDFFGKIKLL